MGSTLPVQLPFDAAFRDVTVASGREHELLPLLGEEPLRITNAKEKRCREYRAGRHVARLALADLGVGPAPLVADRDGVPVCPNGVAVSISHTGRNPTYAAAVASRHVSHLAVDVEELQTVEQRVAERIASHAEMRSLSLLLGDETWAIVCFSAKEAVYKCIFPTLRKMLEFHEVELSLRGEGELLARVLSNPKVPALSVRFACRDSRVTSIAYFPDPWNGDR